MKKIKAALSHLSDRLTYRKGDLAKSRKLAKSYRQLAEREHDRGVAADAAGASAKADRHHRRAEARRDKAIYWRGRIKADVGAIENLEARIEKRQVELAGWLKEHGVTFVGPNRVVGGTPHQRLRAALLKANANYRNGTQPGYYSMSGAARDYAHGLKDYPAGHIWDCSTFADAMYFVCGLDSPSGPAGFSAGGYTGTELAHGKVVPEAEAKPGDLVIYLRFPGDTIGHHVEVVLDPTDKTTMGHGSPPIDPGVFDLFGDGLYVIRRYV